MRSSLIKKLGGKVKGLGGTPEILDLSKASGQFRAEELFKSKSLRVVDDYAEQVLELYAIRNAGKLFSSNFKADFEAYAAEVKDDGSLFQKGKWVHFPWNDNFVHILDKKEFSLVRSARNQDLVTAEEQKKLEGACVGVAGLSVGNSAALTLAMQGIGHLKLADFDNLALSNLNRIRGSVTDLGSRKTEMTARQIYSINPYAKVERFDEGLGESNVDAFFKGRRDLDLVVDEIDQMAVKYLIRDRARKNRVPLIMAADVGDSGVLDIERYDLKPSTKFFNGNLPEGKYSDILNLSKLQTGQLIAKLLGPDNIPPRMQESAVKIGRTLASWPQLGGTAQFNASLVTYAVRHILLGQKIQSGRTVLSLDEALYPGWKSLRSKMSRKKATKNFTKSFFNL